MQLPLCKILFLFIAVSLGAQLAIISAEELSAQEKQMRAEQERIANWHIPMLRDEVRNKAFTLAIKYALMNKPDALVLEIGTGTGILSMLAAKAGARHVVTCESNRGVAETAKEVIRQNGFADKITVIPKSSLNLQVGPGQDLEEKADILISELVDAFLIGEFWLPTLKHARENLVKKGAVILPRGATITIQLAESNFGLGKDATIEGFDFSHFRGPKLTTAHAFMPEAVDYMRLPHVSITKAVDIFNWNFETDAIEPQTARFRLRATNPGVINSIALWWKLHVDDKRSFASGPEKDTHWDQTLYRLTGDLFVDEGDEITVIVWHNIELFYFVVEIPDKNRKANSMDAYNQDAMRFFATYK